MFRLDIAKCVQHDRCLMSIVDVRRQAVVSTVSSNQAADREGSSRRSDG